MTVDELKIKISADAESFKKELQDAEKTVSEFKEKAVNAAKEITAAFSGLADISVSVPQDIGAAAVNPTGITSAELSSILPYADVPVFTPRHNNALFQSGVSYSRTVNVPALDSSETVIGAVSPQTSENQPVHIITTVELDGDKVGESVNVYNLRRNRITNGMYN